MGLEDFED